MQTICYAKTAHVFFLRLRQRKGGFIEASLKMWKIGVFQTNEFRIPQTA